MSIQFCVFYFQSLSKNLQLLLAYPCLSNYSLFFTIYSQTPLSQPDNPMHLRVELTIAHWYDILRFEKWDKLGCEFSQIKHWYNKCRSQSLYTNLFKMEAGFWTLNHVISLHPNAFQQFPFFITYPFNRHNSQCMFHFKESENPAVNTSISLHVWQEINVEH